MAQHHSRLASSSLWELRPCRISTSAVCRNPSATPQVPTCGPLRPRDTRRVGLGAGGGTVGGGGWGGKVAYILTTSAALNWLFQTGMCPCRLEPSEWGLSLCCHCSLQWDEKGRAAFSCMLCCLSLPNSERWERQSVLSVRKPLESTAGELRLSAFSSSGALNFGTHPKFFIPSRI